MDQPSGVIRYPGQGHIDMQTGGARNQTTNFRISGQPGLPPEPQPPQEKGSGKPEVSSITSFKKKLPVNAMPQLERPFKSYCLTGF